MGKSYFPYPYYARLIVDYTFSAVCPPAGIGNQGAIKMWSRIVDSQRNPISITAATAAGGVAPSDFQGATLIHSNLADPYQQYSYSHICEINSDVRDNKEIMLEIAYEGTNPITITTNELTLEDIAGSGSSRRFPLGGARMKIWAAPSDRACIQNSKTVSNFSTEFPYPTSSDFQSSGSDTGGLPLWDIEGPGNWII